MKELRGKVAVITGAASGIGAAMAFRFAAEGMKLVLADIERDALQQATYKLERAGADVLGVPTDVSKAEDVENLARKSLESFGAVHILANNAGVGSPPGTIWQRSIADWQWILGVNLWGVIHGIRVFVPLMLNQELGHIVNTASTAGLLPGPLLGIYDCSKHAVVSISETLHFELAMVNGNVKVSVLCPGPVHTRIGESERNRPPELGSATCHTEYLTNSCGPMARNVITPDIVADRVIEAIRKDQFYVLTHPEYKPHIRAHMEDIVAEQNPHRITTREMRLLMMKPGEKKKIEQRDGFKADEVIGGLE